MLEVGYVGVVIATWALARKRDDKVQQSSVGCTVLVRGLGQGWAGAVGQSGRCVGKEGDLGSPRPDGGKPGGSSDKRRRKGADRTKRASPWFGVAWEHVGGACWRSMCVRRGGVEDHVP